MQQIAIAEPVTWRRRARGKHRQAGHLRTVTRNADDPNRFTVDVIAEQNGALRTLDTAAYEIRVGIGHGTALEQWANQTPTLFTPKTTR
jgi:hypothetical protein